MLTFSDFPVGATGTLPPKLVTREEVQAFAREFDPQPMHLDEAAAAKTLLGGIAASGWHSCAMLMRMICDGFLNNSAGMGSPGLSEVRWLKPVRPGDTLTATYAVAEARISKSRPDMGVCRFLYDVKNQDGVSVMTWDCVHFFACDGGSPPVAG
jgi:acyl dehydratase